METGQESDMDGFLFGKTSLASVHMILWMCMYEPTYECVEWGPEPVVGKQVGGPCRDSDKRGWWVEEGGRDYVCSLKPISAVGDKQPQVKGCG